MMDMVLYVYFWLKILHYLTEAKVVNLILKICTYKREKGASFVIQGNNN